MIGTIQPGKLIPYIRNAVTQGKGDDGLMQRFQLAVYPDSIKEWSYQDNYANTDAKNAAYDVSTRLANMEPPESIGLDDDIFYAHFDDEAQMHFIEWWTKLEKKIRSDDIQPAMEAHLAKYRSLAPSLALIIELADCETVTADFEVKARAFTKAAEWCEYLESHATRIYGMAIEPDIENAKTILKKIKAGKLLKDGALINPLKPRDIRCKNWAGLTETEAVKRALYKLEEYGWMESVTTHRATGRPSLAFHLHPQIAGVDSCKES
jgi:putative DNA primase/helicase